MPKDSTADELAKLAELRSKGVLKDEEFEHQKAKLLGELDPVGTSDTTAVLEGPKIQTAKKRRGPLSKLLILVVIIVLLIVVVKSLSSSSPPATPAQKVAAFNQLVTAVKKDVSYCNTGAQDVQVDLGLIIKNAASASASDFVQLDSAAKQASTACSISGNSGILNLATLNTPSALSGIKSLDQVESDTQTWADQYMRPVFGDIEKLAESNGNSVSAASQLQIDAQKSDTMAQGIEQQFSSAAQQLGITGFKGIGLTLWTTSSASG